MNTFYTTLAYVTEIMYEPNQLTVESIEEEKQNSKYGAGTFQLSSKSIRFRVAKISPTKIGQFVAFWEKDEDHKNQPFSLEDAPDLLVITTIQENQIGQFIFPKELLVQHDILKSRSTKGKMAIRVYPSWDHPTSKQAIATQAWQLPYFIDISDAKALPTDKMMALNSL